MATTLTELRAHLADGRVKRTDRVAQCDYWYDWFCKDSSLAKKTPGLARKALIVAEALGLNPDEYTISLKNNCPLYGSLYDTIRLFPVVEDSAPAYAITPASGHDKTKGEAEIMIFGAGKDETLKFPRWADLETALLARTIPLQTA